MMWDYGEVNPFSEMTGIGQAAWIGVLESYRECAGSIQSSVLFEASAARLPALPIGSCRNLTDPPYYDAVPYADLSDFFYVWLKRTVGDAIRSRLFGLH